MGIPGTNMLFRTISVLKKYWHRMNWIPKNFEESSYKLRKYYNSLYVGTKPASNLINDNTHAGKAQCLQFIRWHINALTYLYVYAL